MKIRPGFGYWVTTYLPIGGDFRRAPASGIAIARVVRRFDDYLGCNIEVVTADGEHVALNSAHIGGGTDPSCGKLVGGQIAIR